MKMSIRLWQTALFVCVTMAAALALYFLFLPSIEDSVGVVAQSELNKNLADLAIRMEDDLEDHIASSPAGKRELTDAREFSDVYRVDFWIYDSKGNEIDSQQSLTQPGSRIAEMVAKGLKRESDEHIDLDKSLVVVSKPIISKGELLGVAIISDNGTSANGALQVARSQLQIALFVAILVSAILGFIFSAVIASEIRRLKEGAMKIANGEYDVTLKPRLVPDEMTEFVEAFNLMAKELERAFDEIENKRHQLFTIVDSMAEGVIEVSADGMINLANKKAAELLDYPVEDLNGSQLEDVISEPNFSKCVRRALAGRDSSGICEYHDRFLLLHGAPIETTGSHLDSQNNGRIALILQDFTKRKRLEQAQRDFTSNASHELRTPIASLKGFLELLEDGAKNKADVRDGFLNTMQKEVDRLQRLIEDLFTLAQLDAGINFLHLSEHPIGDIMKETVAVSSPLAASAGIDLKLDSRENHATVLCDKDRIMQVLLGFIDNAMKFTPKGGEIVIFAHRLDGSVELGVRDTGSGIPAEKTEKIFQRFFRAGSGNGNVSAKGAGLGLSIASEIVKAHGSRIRVISKPREGSTFQFRLRLAKS